MSTLTSADPEPAPGTVVTDDLGRRWINTGVRPRAWIRVDVADNDPESWTKIAGNYGPVTVNRELEHAPGCGSYRAQKGTDVCLSAWCPRCRSKRAAPAVTVPYQHFNRATGALEILGEEPEPDEDAPEPDSLGAQMLDVLNEAYNSWEDPDAVTDAEMNALARELQSTAEGWFGM